VIPISDGGLVLDRTLNWGERSNYRIDLPANWHICRNLGTNRRGIGLPARSPVLL